MSKYRPFFEHLEVMKYNNFNQSYKDEVSLDQHLKEYQKSKGALKKMEVNNEEIKYPEELREVASNINGMINFVRPHMKIGREGETIEQNIITVDIMDGPHKGKRVTIWETQKNKFFTTRPIAKSVGLDEASYTADDLIGTAFSFDLVEKEWNGKTYINMANIREYGVTDDTPGDDVPF